MLLAPGLVLTVVAWTAFGAFSTAIVEQDAPPSAHLVRCVFLTFGVFIPVVLLILTWWWLGRDRRAMRHEMVHRNP
jgi:hypothetical protein